MTYLLLKRYRNNLDVIIFIISVFFVGAVVPFIFNHYLDLFTESSLIVNNILCLNIFIFYLLVWWIIKPSSQLRLFSEVKIVLFNASRRNIVAIPAVIRNFFMIIYVIVNLIIFFSNSAFGLDESRAESWNEVVAISSTEGAGFQGLISLLVSGLFFVSVYEGFQSRSVRTKYWTFIFFCFNQLISILTAILYGVHRSPVIFELIFLVIVYHFYYRRIKLRMLKIGSLVFILLLPFYFSLTAYIRAGSFDSVTREDISVLHGLSGLSTSLEFVDLFDRLRVGELHYEFGKQFVYNTISFIPRVIWKEKPHTSFSFRKSTEIYGEMGVDGWVHTYTVWGEGYSQFGLSGTVMATLSLFFLITLFLNISLRFPVYSFIILKVLILKFPILLRADLSTFFGNSYRVIFSILFVWFIKKIISSFAVQIRQIKTKNI